MQALYILKRCLLAAIGDWVGRSPARPSWRHTVAVICIRVMKGRGGELRGDRTR